MELLIVFLAVSFFTGLIWWDKPRASWNRILFAMCLLACLVYFYYLRFW